MKYNFLPTLRFTIYLLAAIAFVLLSTNVYSKYGNQENDDILFLQFKKYLSCLSHEDLDGLNEMSSSMIPFTEGKINVEMGEPEKNINFIKKPYTDGMVKFSKRIWNRIKYIYGYDVENIDNNHKILILHAKGLGINREKKKNIKIRFNFEFGVWKINEIEHTLEAHTLNVVFYTINLITKNSEAVKQYRAYNKANAHGKI